MRHADPIGRSLAGLCLTVALCGCARYKPISGPVVLTEVATVLAPHTPLHARGIKIDLCLTLESGYRSQVGKALGIEGPDKRVAMLSATLHDTKGDVIPEQGGANVGPDACFVWHLPEDSNRRVASIELRAVGAPVRVRRITWWSGTPHGFL